MNAYEENLFHKALETPIHGRKKFLDDACVNNSSLRQRLSRLLEAHEHPSDFMVRPASISDPKNHSPNDDSGTVDLSGRSSTAKVGSPIEHESAGMAGQWIGPYKLLEEIGGGGMGTVWMAEQVNPVRRKVALKLIKPGMDSTKVIARFEAERQALAMMDHPNIARVLDAGTTESGLPYFVMELVRGISITRYCDERRLTLNERLKLFLPVCLAIQHAHQKGIIHRDIKPSNVLVASYDGHPVPKVIDFGIAKAVDYALIDDTLYTGFGMIMGTLEYMSPEQAEFNAIDIDTRSDIYGLGVLLYELLTGTTPLLRHQLREKGITEGLRMIREQDPPRPSLRLTESPQAAIKDAGRFQSDPHRLAKWLRRELDWIVMKALEKNRARRYATANALAMDIERYLNNQSVVACPPSLRYKLHKFVRQHWYGVLSGGILLLVMAGGIVASLQQARRAWEAEARERGARVVAENNFRMAREAVDLGFTKVSESPELKAHGLEALRKELLGQAKDFYGSLAIRQNADPTVRADQAKACLRLAKVNEELGDRSEAFRNAQVAEGIFRQLNLELPESPDYLDGLAETLIQKAECVLAFGRPQECQTYLEHAVEIRRDLLNRFDNPGHMLGLAVALNALGKFYHWESGQTEKAERILNEALQLCEQLTRDAPEVAEYQIELANTFTSLGSIYVPRGDHALSLEYALRSLPLLERLAEEHPAAPEYQRRLLHAWTAMQVAYHNLRQPMDSLAIFEKAKPVADKLAQVHPDVPEYRSMARQLEVLYGGALSQLGDYRKAVEAVESAMVDSPGGGILYNAACTYALAAASVRDDKNLDAAERELIRKKYQDRAMELLIKVESLGWFAGGSAAESLTNDHDFDILRDRQDFQNLLTNVQSRLGSSVSNQSID